MKAQPTEWEKDATNYMTNKWLTKHINNSYYSIKKKNTTQFKKWTEDWNGHFSKEEI